MVKIATFLLASVAIMAVSTQAQVSTEPRFFSEVDVQRFAADSSAELMAADGDDVHIMPLPYSHTLLRRNGSTAPKKPTTPKKPTCPEAKPKKKPTTPKEKPTKPTTKPAPKPTSKPAPKPTSKPAPKPTTTPVAKPTTKPAPEPTKPANPGSNLTEEQQLVLDTHNKLRALHGSAPLTWSDKAANFGDDWIQQCAFKHSNGPFGENLAASHRNLEHAITSWYNEEQKYDYNSPGFSMATGHFTQVVWRATTAVGCAVKFCPTSNWNIYICNYDPPGNMNYVESFRANVLPLRN